MKNNKQFKLNKKHPGLFVGLGIGLASIIAGSTAAIVLAAKKTTNESLAGKVKFVAGTNHSFETSGSALTINLDKPTQLIQILPKDTLVSGSNKQIPASDFVGWAKTKDFSHGKISMSKVLSAYSYVEPATSLTAVYRNNVTSTGDWHTVTFTKGSAKVILTGNTVINVLEGTQFQTINKPGCESQAAGGEQKCIGWASSSAPTVPITDTTPITTNMTLVPIMSEAAVITFKPSSTDTGATIEGTAVVTAKVGTTFDKINIPKVDYSGCTGEKIFYGWYKQQSASWPDSDKYTNTTQLKGTVDAVARSIDVTSADFIKFHAVQPATGSVTYQGNPDFAVANGEKWGSFNLPIPVAAELKVNGWEWSTTNSPTATWTPCETGYIFTDGATIYIRPVMTSSITTVRIKTEKTPYIAPECKTKLYAEVLPKESTQTVTWKIFEDEEGQIEITDPEYASIDENGNILIKADYASARDTIYVQATSTIAEVSSAITPIIINLPTKDNASFWTFDESNSTWYRIENVYDKTKAIDCYMINATTKSKSIARSEFNLPVYMGDKITSIDNNFLYNCTNFDNWLVTTSTVDTIEDNFLFGCSKFNQHGIGDFVRPIKHIGNNFMNGCTGYDNEGYSEPIYFDNIEEIGNDMCKGMTAFNTPIKFGNKLKTIGTGFMDGCIKFNNGSNDTVFILPESLTSIGGKFMHECADFTATMELDCPGTVFPSGAEVTTLSSQDDQSAIAKTGFKVIGTGAGTFPFGTISGLEGYNRKVTVDASVVQSVSISDDSEPITQYAIGETFSTIGIKLNVTVQKPSSTETETKEIESGFKIGKMYEGEFVEIPEGYEFEDGDEGEYTLYASYCNVQSSNTITITVGDQPVPPTPAYGDPIDQTEFMNIYKTYEAKYVSLVKTPLSLLPVEATFSGLWYYKVDEEEPTRIDDYVVATINNPLKAEVEDETSDYIPAYAYLTNTSLVEEQRNATIHLAGGKSEAFSTHIEFIGNELGLTPSFFKDTVNNTITVCFIGEDGAERYSCTHNSNGLISHLNNTVNSGTGRYGFDATYSANANKREFLDEYKTVYNEVEREGLAYRSVELDSGSYIIPADSEEHEAIKEVGLEYQQVVDKHIPVIKLSTQTVSEQLVNGGQMPINELCGYYDRYLLGSSYLGQTISYDLTYDKDNTEFVITLKLGNAIWAVEKLDADNLLLKEYTKNALIQGENTVHIVVSNWITE